MGSVLTMYAGGTGGNQNAVAQIDVPFTTDLLGIKWSVMAFLDADAENFTAQIGFGPTLVAANDSRSIIDTVSMEAELTTSGVYHNWINQYVAMPELQLMGGERLYLHLSATAGVISVTYAHLHLAGDLDKPSTRRRA